MTPLGNKLMINRAGHFGLDFEDRGCVRKLDCVALLALAAADDDDHDVANDRLFFQDCFEQISHPDLGAFSSSRIWRTVDRQNCNTQTPSLTNSS